MKTTGIFTLHRHIIKFKKYGEGILLIPFGDVHRSSPLHHRDKWKEFLAWAKKQKNAYFLGMGDYDDLTSTSERSVLSNSSIHESTRSTLDQLYIKQTEEFIDDISFMRGRLIGLIEGNHYSNLSSGITTTQYMALKMGCKYLGVSSFIRLCLEKDGQSRSVDVWAHHGLGGGRKIGTSISKMEDLTRMADARIYLMGHDHKRQVAMTSRLSLSNGNTGLNLQSQNIVMARTGSFLKGYENEKPSYITDACMPPSDLGAVTIVITPCRSTKNSTDQAGKREDKRWVEIGACI